MDISLYRARIGLFAARSWKRAGVVYNCSTITVSFTIGTLMVLLLLCSGNVERNPGPSPPREVGQRRLDSFRYNRVDEQPNVRSEQQARTHDGSRPTTMVPPETPTLLNILNAIKQLDAKVETRFDEVLSMINTLKNENIVLKHENALLSKRISALERDTKMKNVIIKGIPVQQNESYADIVKIVENVVVQLGVADETNQIVTVRRLRSSNDNKPLIVNFTSSRTALMILKAAKTKKLPGILVKQDLPYNVRIARRNLSPFFTEAINQVCGTTGEGMSMTVEERMTVAEKWVEVGKNKLENIIVQVGAHNLIESQKLAAHAEMIGATAIASLPSLFFKQHNSVDALIEYCKHIAASAPNLPFYYYHFPRLTNVRVDMQEFFRKANAVIPTLAGVKFQSSQLMEASMIQCNYTDNYQVMLACDEVYLGAMAMGIDWAIGTTYSFLPHVVHRMIEAYNRGDMEGARTEQIRIQKVIHLRNTFGQDIGTYKEIMSLIGLDFGPPRLPLAPFTDDQREQLKNELDNIGFFTWVKGEDVPPLESPKKVELVQRRLNRRHLDRTTSLLTSDGDAPKSPTAFSHFHRSGSSSSSIDQVFKRLHSSASDQDVTSCPHPAHSVREQHKPVEKQASVTSLLTQ